MVDKCICGRKDVKKFILIGDKKLYLCPYCAYNIMRQYIIFTFGKFMYTKVLLLLIPEEGE